MQSPVFVDGTTVTGDGTVVHPLAGSGGGGVPGGTDQAIQFNQLGAFGGDAVILSYDYTAQFFSFNSDPLPNSGFGITAQGDGSVGSGQGLLQAGRTGSLLIDMGAFTPDSIVIQVGETGGGLFIQNTSGAAGIAIQDTSVGGGSGLQLFCTNNGISIAAPQVAICSGPTQLLSFFGVTPVAQQATPVTLGDVIAILQAFGFAA